MQHTCSEGLLHILPSMLQKVLAAVGQHLCVSVDHCHRTHMWVDGKALEVVVDAHFGEIGLNSIFRNRG